MVAHILKYRKRKGYSRRKYFKNCITISQSTSMNNLTQSYAITSS